MENITFHTLPKDEKLREVWIKATGRQNWEPSVNTRICSKHFESRVFRRTSQKVFLDKLAIPKFFIHDTTNEVVDNQAQAVQSQQDNNLMIECPGMTDATNRSYQEIKSLDVESVSVCFHLVLAVTRG
ncbi:hypothetical protein evm_003531 [Chilo suppressalis]|nr:hypothetical protein evm_003531 [Chilo suppressalis]